MEDPLAFDLPLRSLAPPTKVLSDAPNTIRPLVGLLSTSEVLEREDEREERERFLLSLQHTRKPQPFDMDSALYLPHQLAEDPVRVSGYEQAKEVEAFTPSSASEMVQQYLSKRKRYSFEAQERAGIPTGLSHSSLSTPIFHPDMHHNDGDAEIVLRIGQRVK